MGGAEKVVKMWIRLLSNLWFSDYIYFPPDTDQGQIHSHLKTDVMN